MKPAEREQAAGRCPFGHWIPFYIKRSEPTHDPKWDPSSLALLESLPRVTSYLHEPLKYERSENYAAFHFTKFIPEFKKPSKRKFKQIIKKINDSNPLKKVTASISTKNYHGHKHSGITGFDNAPDFWRWCDATFNSSIKGGKQELTPFAAKSTETLGKSSPFCYRKYWVLAFKELLGLRNNSKRYELPFIEDRGLETLAEWQTHCDRDNTGKNLPKLRELFYGSMGAQLWTPSPGARRRARRSKDMSIIGGPAVLSPLGIAKCSQRYIANPNFDYIIGKWHLKPVNALPRRSDMWTDHKSSFGQISWGRYEKSTRFWYDIEERLVELDSLEKIEAPNKSILHLNVKYNPPISSAPVKNPPRKQATIAYPACAFTHWEPLANYPCYPPSPDIMRRIERSPWKVRKIKNAIRINPDLANRSLKGLWVRPGAGGLTDEIDNRTYTVIPTPMAYIKGVLYPYSWEPPEPNNSHWQSPRLDYIDEIDEDVPDGQDDSSITYGAIDKSSYDLHNDIGRVYGTKTKLGYTGNPFLTKKFRRCVDNSLCSFGRWGKIEPGTPGFPDGEKMAAKNPNWHESKDINGNCKGCPNACTSSVVDREKGSINVDKALSYPYNCFMTLAWIASDDFNIHPATSFNSPAMSDKELERANKGHVKAFQKEEMRLPRLPRDNEKITLIRDNGGSWFVPSRTVDVYKGTNIGHLLEDHPQVGIEALDNLDSFYEFFMQTWPIEPLSPTRQNLIEEFQSIQLSEKELPTRDLAEKQVDLLIKYHVLRTLEQFANREVLCFVPDVSEKLNFGRYLCNDSTPADVGETLGYEAS